MRGRKSDGSLRPEIGARGPYGKTMLPVGSEYVGKDGLVMVKVADWPTKPGSKDNWKPKQRVAWERANGRTLGPGEIVIFCDHDARNFDPANLLAVERRYVARMNSMGEWHDRQTAEAVLAAAMVEAAALDAAARLPRVCGRCGRRFVPDTEGKRFRRTRPPRLCPECQDRFKREHGRGGEEKTRWAR